MREGRLCRAMAMIPDNGLAPETTDGGVGKKKVRTPRHIFIATRDGNVCVLEQRVNSVE